VLDEYKPAAHGVHAADPAATWYVPAGQLTQLDDALAATVGEKVPEAHGLHVDVPVASA